MRIYYLSALIFVASFFIACTKEVPCYNVVFEIEGANASVDSIDFRLAGSGASYRNPDAYRSYSNIRLPFSDTVMLCKEDFDYNLRVYDADPTLSLTLKIYANGSLVRQKSGSPNGFIEIAGGINDQ